MKRTEQFITEYLNATQQVTRVRTKYNILIRSVVLLQFFQSYYYTLQFFQSYYIKFSHECTLLFWGISNSPRGKFEFHFSPGES